MTQTNEQSPDEMPAGPELDVLMAEKVLGLEVYQGKYDNDAHTWVAGPIINPPEDYVIVMGDRVQRCKGDEKSKDWSPSSDIVAAWEIDHEGWLWTFAEHPSCLIARVWHPDRSKEGEMYPRNVEVTIVQIGWEEAETKAQVYALARSRAALKVVEASH